MLRATVCRRNQKSVRLQLSSWCASMLFSFTRVDLQVAGYACRDRHAPATKSCGENTVSELSVVSCYFCLVRSIRTPEKYLREQHTEFCCPGAARIAPAVRAAAPGCGCPPNVTFRYILTTLQGGLKSNRVDVRGS